MSKNELLTIKDYKLLAKFLHVKEVDKMHVWYTGRIINALDKRNKGIPLTEKERQQANTGYKLIHENYVNPRKEVVEKVPSGYIRDKSGVLYQILDRKGNNYLLKSQKGGYGYIVAYGWSDYNHTWQEGVYCALLSDAKKKFYGNIKN